MNVLWHILGLAYAAGFMMTAFTFTQTFAENREKILNEASGIVSGKPDKTLAYTFVIAVIVTTSALWPISLAALSFFYPDEEDR